MKEIKPGWIAAAVVGVIAVVFLLVRASETIAPKPVALWVAVQASDSAVAVAGPVHLPPGEAFRLHAVVEAETISGERVYYTEAEELELGGDRVPAAVLRRWNRSLEPRILWFTVDGSPPFRELTGDEKLREPNFKETFRSDWAQAWAVPGDLRPAVENYLPGADRVDRAPRFGTQRFHVRMEFFAEKGALVPEYRLKSWGAEALLEHSSEFPTVVASLDGSLAVPSRVFGLPQLEVSGDPPAAGLETLLADWTRRLLAFSRISVLAEWLRERGTSWEALEWSAIEIGASEAAVGPGDLLRVGNRIVFILEDRGDEGRLDYEDLCLDFDRGARVLPLGSVFTGEGLVDWAAAPAHR